MSHIVDVNIIIYVSFFKTLMLNFVDIFKSNKLKKNQHFNSFERP